MLNDFLALQDARIYLTGWVSADRSQVGVGQVYKDRVIDRIIEVNSGKRPIFFAATIPFDNIWIDHLSRLQMEGLAYRLVDTRAADGYPTVDPERLIANVFGIYDFTAMLDGDSDAARRRFREQNQVPVDADPATASDYFAEGEWDARDVWRDYGDFRTEIHFSPNGRNLKGNYPLGLLRASQVFLNRTQAMDVDDPDYLLLLTKVESCLEMVHRLQDQDVTMDQLAFYYPVVLASVGRPDEAIAYVDEVTPRLPMQQSWEVTEQLAMTLASGDDAPLAVSWLNRRIEEDPADRALYYMAFKVQRTLVDLEGCRRVHQRWRDQFGSPDSEMAAAIAELEALVNRPPELSIPTRRQ